MDRTNVVAKVNIRFSREMRILISRENNRGTFLKVIEIEWENGYYVIRVLTLSFLPSFVSSVMYEY